MPDSIKRWFGIVIGIVGAVASGGLIMSMLTSGVAPGFSRAAAIAGQTYARASNPSQFWFMLLLFCMVGAGFAWLAWRAWRE